MVCERAADNGGESYMIDGHDILRSFPAEQQQLYFDTPVEAKNFDKMLGKQSGGVAEPDGAVQQVDGSGRWCLRVEGGGGFNRDQPCEGEARQLGTELLTQWGAARDRAGEAAPRFRLLPGQAMIVDNYRWLHAREPDDGGGSRLVRPLSSRLARLAHV